MLNQVQKATTGAVLATSMFIGMSEITSVDAQESGLHEQIDDLTNVNFSLKSSEVVADNVKLLANSSPDIYTAYKQNAFSVAISALIAAGLLMRATAEKLTANLK
jgi:hypothetical protein